MNIYEKNGNCRPGCWFSPVSVGAFSIKDKSIPVIRTGMINQRPGMEIYVNEGLDKHQSGVIFRRAKTVLGVWENWEKFAGRRL